MSNYKLSSLERERGREREIARFPQTQSTLPAVPFKILHSSSFSLVLKQKTHRACCVCAVNGRGHAGCLLKWTAVIPGSLCSIQAVYTLSSSGLSGRGGGGQFS